MIYEMPSTVYGETHVYWHQVEVVPDQSVKMRGNLGSLDADGNFVQNDDFANGWAVRNIAGAEFDDFLAYCDDQRAGAPTEGTSNFRDADLGYWLTTYGWRDQINSWSPE